MQVKLCAKLGSVFLQEHLAQLTEIQRQWAELRSVPSGTKPAREMQNSRAENLR